MNHFRYFTLKTIGLIGILSLTGVVVNAAEYKELTSSDYSVDIIARDLEHPWSLAKLPDGRLLVTERTGALRIIKEGFVSKPVANVPKVFSESQGGLFDVVLHPDYAHNGWIYLTYAHGNRQANATRLARARLEGSGLIALEVLFTASPWKNTPVHYGGRLAFLADNTLLLGIGDGFDFREMAQRNDSHLGTIVRLNDDGSIPSDNPFIDVDESLDAIWSYGHRNPQAIIYDKHSDTVVAHEHGPAGGDELNIIVKGHNYGWPIATYGRDYSGAAISPFTEYEGTSQPLLQWTPSIAPAGMARVSASAFQELEGDLLVATLKAREIRRLHQLPDGTFVQQSLFKELGHRMRDVRVFQDGSIYLLTDSASGFVLRIRPKGQ